MRSRTAPVAALTVITAPFLCAATGDSAPAAYAVFFHLTIGNVLLGFLEGALLAALFKRRIFTGVLIMTLANVAVSFIGGADMLWFAQAAVPRILGGAPLYRAGAALAVSWMVGLAAAILIATPFCRWMLRGTVDAVTRWKGALLAAVISQAVGFAVIVPFHLGAGTLSVFTAVKTDPKLSFLTAPSLRYRIYFIHTETGEVHRVRPDGTSLERVAAATGLLRSLALSQSTTSAGCDLLGIPARPVDAEPIVVVRRVCGSVPRDKPVGAAAASTDGTGDARDMRTTPSGVSVSTSGQPHEGLRVSLNGDVYHVGLEAFPLSWEVLHPTIIDGDVVIFQFGGHIAALEPRTRRIGMVFARGRSPVVVPDR